MKPRVLPISDFDWLPIYLKARVDAALPVLYCCLHVMDPQSQFWPDQEQRIMLWYKLSSHYESCANYCESLKILHFQIEKDLATYDSEVIARIHKWFTSHHNHYKLQYRPENNFIKLNTTKMLWTLENPTNPIDITHPWIL